MKSLLPYFLVVFIIIVIVGLDAANRPLATDSLVHWHATILDLTVAPKRLYETLGFHLKQQQYPGITISQEQLYEGHTLTAKRVYLRVQKHKLKYYVFAAPVGKSFFISSWLIFQRSLVTRALLMLPLVGPLLGRLLQILEAPTFYNYDSALHFHETMHLALLHIVDQLTTAENIAPLDPEARRPIMPELYARPTVPKLAL